MESHGANHQPRRSQWAELRLAADTLTQAELAFAHVIAELDQGEWHLRQWAEELGISEDEMFIEVDRRIHQPAA